ncbi:ring-hydroxylating oxygenase subunit alpha [Variovorax sp. WS11]|uniref:Rieske 2Fe-2S domain-containing protein n=1 Tax=Variovorax sp. WS11 TaxID=1105204 RepID=UPI000D0DA67E|nr:Rieske 2Fe-2S domain-containing protein [Variovorax sp. WS11]NDZ18534.1 Rieske 2Fe-2S domain-containing protein [Variovorax sp. WS11]PSL85167.1 ring-hydroxylating oxygenase subunit alpha [Variovorax sp. WS11]
MLSHEDNETLVRIGPGTPMGQLMRLYWIPFLPSKDLEADGQPQRVRLLGEDLIAFRDSEGRIGLVDHACPHRGAPLVFGRNEDCGLRCIYHGWKFGTDGRVVDMPAEPADSRLKDKVRIKHYRCEERNGIVWAWMGADADSAPPLPHMEWNLVPEDNVHVSFRVQECNWLQAIEGEIDSAHAPILHGRIDKQGAISDWTAKKDLRPTFECKRQDFGMSIASRRVLDAENCYWRVNQFLLPFYTLVPPQSQYPELSGHAWVPMDDEHTLCIMFSYTPASKLYDKSRQLFEQGHAGRETGHPSVSAYAPRPASEPFAKYWTRFNLQSAFLFNYDAQTKTWFSGLPGLWVQDAACQSGVAPIYDRSKEHLGISDTGIAMTRRLLLESVRNLDQRQQKPVRHDDPELFMVRAVSLTLPTGAAWNEAGRGPMTARLGADFGYTP